MQLIHGECLEKLKELASNSVDSLVTDPPAGISFMGKDWDGDKGGRDAWIAWMTEVMGECLRVLKPGAHALVWAIPRTSHWTTTALENAGFEIRDVVTHLFGTGFPKSLDVSKAIDKAAGAEREVICQKAYSNQDTRGNPISETGGRGPGLGQDKPRLQLDITAPATDSAKQWQGWGTALKPACEFWILCRKPISEKTVAANVLKWGTGALNIDASRIGTDKRHPGNYTAGNDGGTWANRYGSVDKSTFDSNQGRFPANLVLDEEAAAALDKQSGASRFFYVAKASKADKGADNTHPTVKSTALMSYLIKLVTPPNGLVLDPFMGSGSTGVAAQREGFHFTGIEKDDSYFSIAVKRIKND